MEKIKKKVSVVNWSSYELDGKLTDVILKLQSLMLENPGYFDFVIDVKSESEYYGSCSTTISIDAFRWETDEECEERKIASKKRSESAKNKAEANAKRERTLYESLKRKFEKEINEG